MKKIWLFLMAIAIFAIVVFFIFILNQPNEQVLSNGATLSYNLCASIPKVTVIHKEGCPACSIVLPRLQELEQELDQEFKYYDVAIVEDAKEIRDKGLITKYVPTVIINCKVYVGVMEKQEYKDLILE